MNNLKEYILEKFKISKDINKNSSISIEVIELITSYLESHKYFNYNIKDFKIEGKTDEDISLILPKELTNGNLVQYIAVDITRKLLKELKLDLYWEWDQENHKICWGNDIV